MAKTREAVCEFYESNGSCTKGRKASHFKYYQKCDKYRPRARAIKHNKKKEKIRKTREREWKNFDY